MEYDFRRKATPVFIGLLLLLTSTFAFGQGIVTGSISGVVQDQQQAVVSGAKVTAKNNETNQEFSAESNSVGSYSLRGLLVGTYTVTIEAPKFQKLRFSKVPVSSDRNSDLGIMTLTIGGAEEVVNVESTPPLVETKTSQIATTFGSKKVTDLPILNGGFDILALLVPGVASVGDQGFSNTNGTGISSNGQRGRSNNFQIEGQSNNDNSIAGPSFFLGNADIISEFQIVTNNFSAEYGRNMGSVVNYVTKSGSNAYHGTASWLHTNAFTDSLANQDKSELLGHCVGSEDPALTGCLPIEVPKYIDNRVAGTVGGPIVKDKAWFFGSVFYQRTRSLFNANSAPSLTPTPDGLAMLAATYCAGVVPSCPSHPALGALLVNGPYSVTVGNPSPVINAANPAALLNVTDSVTALAGVPFAPVARAVSDSYKDWDASGRVDIQLTQKDRFFARYLFQDGLQEANSGRFSAGAFVDTPFRSQNIGLDWVRNWSNTFLNQARFSYRRAFFAFEGGVADPECVVATPQLCATGISFSSQMLNFGYQSNLPQNRLLNDSQWQDNDTWVKGRHTLKFGGEYARQRSPAQFLPFQNGDFRLGSTANLTNFNRLLRNAPNTATATRGPSRLTLDLGPTLFNFKEQDAAFYFQDDWRVKDNLTLNLGICWEFNQQAINLLNQLTVARESDPATAFWNTALPLDRITVPAIPNDTNNWAPNIGFAWTPRFWEGLFGRDKTVVRGGYRIAYDPAFYNTYLNMATAAPVVNLANLVRTTCLTAVPAGICSTVPAGTQYNGVEIQAARLSFMPFGVNPGTRSQTQVTRDFHNPYTQQWALGIQRQITPKIAAEVRYVGNHTVGNFQTINANPAGISNVAPALGSPSAGLVNDFPSLYVGTPCADATQPGFGEARPDCTTSLTRLRANTAFSIYHGLQSRLDVQNWHGLTAGFNHTYSRTIDNVSEIFSTFGGGTTIAGSQNPFDPNRPERAVSGISYPHVVSFYWIYELPWLKNQQGFVGHLLGGWEFSGTHRYRGGQVYTPGQFFGSTYCDPNWYLQFFGGDTCRPFLSNPKAPLDTVGQCFDNTLPDCGLGSFYTGAPLSASDVHWIFNDDVAALFFGNPFGGVGRNTLRGQTVNHTDVTFQKRTKITERVTVQFQASAFIVFNRQFRGVPDPFQEDCPFAPTGTPGDGFCEGKRGSFANNFFNDSGRRRLTFGLKVIF